MLSGRLRRSAVVAVAALGATRDPPGSRLTRWRLLIPNGRVEVVKVVVITALVLNTVRKPVTVGIHAALWGVVGIYTATNVNNLAAIATIR